jgi:F0F1-type ATP synthase assembly protein I
MVVQDNNKPTRSWWQPAITLFGELSAWIAGPILIALFIGKWLDEKYQTKPWLFLGATGMAFIITNIGIVYQTKKFIERAKIKTKKVNKTPERK